MARLAVLSFHTSPLAQPGTGDGGGMNVYVHELAAALARSGTEVDVYTRADDPGRPAVVSVEPGLRVHHIAAGPLAPVSKDGLLDLVPEFADGVAVRFARSRPDAIHANYWLSGIAGHDLKHRFDLPLACTFHTLGRVKGVDSGDACGRADAEAAVIGCSDAIFANCPDEAAQLIDLYDAPADRIEIIPPGVDHAFFAPGSRAGALRAIGVEGPVVLYVGRIQPLKGLDIAVSAFACLPENCTLVVIGGPSGPEGLAYLDGVHALARTLGVANRIRWVPPQPHELLASYYRAASVVLVPSQSESFGLVALEAAACGTPVVATAVGGLHTLVLDGRTGFLRPRSAADFAAAARAALVDEGVLSTAAAAHGRRFSWSAAAASVAGVVARLVDRVPVACR